MLENNFIIITTVYIFASVCNFGLGYFYKLVCPLFARLIIENLVTTTTESAIVISIMYLHHKCAQIHNEEASIKPRVSLNKTTIVTSNSELVEKEEEKGEKEEEKEEFE